MLKRTVSRDGRVAQLSDRSALLYVMSIPHLDVEGRMGGLPLEVVGEVVPYIAAARQSDWTLPKVSGYLAEWGRTLDEDNHPRPLVLHYCVAGVWVLQFEGFKKNQRLRADREAPSRFPAPPGDLFSMAVPTAVPAPAVGPDVPTSDGVPSPPLFDLPGGPTPGVDPGELRTQTEEEVQEEENLQSSTAEASYAARAALSDFDLETVGADLERKLQFKAPDPVVRLLAVLPDHDRNTERVLRSYLAELPAHAADWLVDELDAAPGVRRRTPYAVGILKRWSEKGVQRRSA